MAVTLQDVTHLRHFDGLKTDLVATVAHEFRCLSLTSLRMAIILRLEEGAGPLTQTGGASCTGPGEDCERTQAMVDDLLYLRASKAECDVRSQPMEVEALLDQAVETERAAADEAGRDLRKEAAPGPPHVAADRERIHLVLVNLVSNAIRHTPKGGVVRILAVEGPHGHVTLRVTDSGQGTPLSSSRASSRSSSGGPADAGRAGLGLYIARETVRAHKGRHRSGQHARPGGEHLGSRSPRRVWASIDLSDPRSSTPGARAVDELDFGEAGAEFYIGGAGSRRSGADESYLVGAAAARGPFAGPGSAHAFERSL